MECGEKNKVSIFDYTIGYLNKSFSGRDIMIEDRNWIWVDNFFDKIHKPYLLVSFAVSVLIFLIYLFFSKKVVFFPWEFYHILEVTALSFLVGFQLGGIRYLLINMRKIFKEIKSNTGQNLDKLYLDLSSMFANSKIYYIIILLIIVPFVLIEILQISSGKVTFYAVEPTKWSLLLDIYNNFIGYLMLLLLAILLFMIFNIIQILNKMGSESYDIKIDIFNIDQMGGLKPVSDFNLKVLIIYFICVTLAIVSYVNPFSIFSYESFFLIILLLVGVSFFLLGLGTIRKLLRRQIEKRINVINARYEKQEQRLMELADTKKSYEKGEELKLVSEMLETLHIERERMRQLYSKSTGYDLTTLIEFVSSFILPLGAFSEKLFNLGFELKKFF